MDEVLAARLQAHNLGRRVRGVEDAAALGASDAPRGAARDALAARVAGPPALERLVFVWGPRGAARAIARADARVVTRGLLPPDEQAARAIVEAAGEHLDAAGWGALDALGAVAEAMRAAVEGGPLERDALHQALRERLPGELLWACRGCGTRHVHPSVWRAAGLSGTVQRVDLPGSRAAGFAALDLPAGDDAEAGAELARRLLRLHGPATTAEVRGFLGTSTAHATALLAAAGARPVDRDGRRAWAAPDPPQPVPHAGVRLLPPGDPLLEGRDRARLLPDPALRKALVGVLSRTGAVLADGRIAGTWRARLRGARLEVTIDAPGVDAAALSAEASTLAAARDTVATIVRGG